MLFILEALLLTILLITAIFMLAARKSFTAIIVFTAFSLVMSVLWIIIKSPDLAITEAAVGAGITSILFYVALKNMDELKLNQSKTKEERTPFIYKLFSLIFTLGIIGILLVTVSFLPQQGSPHVPTMNEVFTRYIESGVEETGAINIVAAVILDYRAFDTFGEATMLFTATIAVVSLLKKEKDEERL